LYVGELKGEGAVDSLALEAQFYLVCVKRTLPKFVGEPAHVPEVEDVSGSPMKLIVSAKTQWRYLWRELWAVMGW
jgi:hypothetical protein